MNVIQFPLKHGPITEREHAKLCVQDAANEVFHRQIDSQTADRMADLLIQRKQRMQPVLIRQVMADDIAATIEAEMCSPGVLQNGADPRRDLSPDARRELEKLGRMLTAKVAARKKT